MISTGVLFDELTKHNDKDLPFVLYRKPGENLLNAVLQLDNASYHLNNFNESGFVFAPFRKSDSAFILPFSKSKCLQSEIKEKIKLKTDRSLKDFIEEEEKKTDYQTIIKKAISSIKTGNFEKVVLSRALTVARERSLFDMFSALINLHSEAFVYLFSHPKIGTWMGASPELLVKIQGNCLKTVSLAGTQPVVDNQAVKWTPKETNEQQIVTDFLIDNLKPYSKAIVVNGPETVKAGQLLHLKTGIEIELKPDGFDLNEILEALHPSPAICGMPRQQALDFITRNEGYDRSFYSGFLGEWIPKPEGVSQLFVNLRCMQITDDIIQVYIGGGITRDSIPELEWEETVSKSKTMLGVIGFSPK